MFVLVLLAPSTTTLHCTALRTNLSSSYGRLIVRIREQIVLYDRMNLRLYRAVQQCDKVSKRGGYCIDNRTYLVGDSPGGNTSVLWCQNTNYWGRFGGVTN